MKPTPKSELEKIFFDEIEDGTPDYVKNNKLIDLSEKQGFAFTITKDHLLRNTRDPRPLEHNEKRSDIGLGLRDWLSNYKREAMISTAGIRGPQNPLYPWDTRYPINLIGVMLATVGKALVANEKHPDTTLTKIAACEVRYNSKEYVELIARIQAAAGIKTLNTKNLDVLPIWMVSFLTFMLDLYGGEYVTSSHAISKKIATKDLNHEGSQYIPAESIKFVNKIEQIFKTIEETDSYTVRISSSDDKLIDDQYLEELEHGIPMYVEYLKKGIAHEHNLKLIQNTTNKLLIDCMGGSMYPTMDKILKALNIREQFNFLHSKQDPFFHEIGKTIIDGEYIDYSCDSTIVFYDHKNGTYELPVLQTMKYDELLKEYPIGTTILMTDPDGDRLVTTQIESTKAKDKLDKLGVLTMELNEERLLAMYLPNQSFLLTFDFQKKALETAGLWDEYNWFMIKTTPSSMTWDLWAKANNVPVINVPVGFKEIAAVLQKIEAKLKRHQDDDIVIADIFGKNVNIGSKPRLLFAGEESGGEIFGPTELIKSNHGRTAMAMREKSAGEAIIITSAMASSLIQQEKLISDYLQEIYDSNNIATHFDVRVDVKYYNENESDIVKLNAQKEAGMEIRTTNDLFFLTIALGIRDKMITLEQARDILQEAFPKLDFSNMMGIFFVGDGTYIQFTDKFVEVRPSGTDAVNKSYSTSKTKDEAIEYTQTLANYDGTRTPLHKQLISDSYYDKVKEYSLKLLREFQAQGMPEQKYTPPDNI